MLAELAAEELREKDVQRAREEMEAAIRRREQLQQSYRQQLQERRRHLQEEEQQEELYKKQVSCKMATILFYCRILYSLFWYKNI